VRLFRKPLIYVNILAGIALLIAYLSPFISPAHLWLIAFFGLAYPYLLLLNLLFMLFWIIRFRKEFLISMIAILLGWNYLNSYFPIRLKRTLSEEDTSETANTIKILSYNVRLFNLYNWNSNPGANQEMINMIRSEKPDFICLQEFYSRGAPPEDTAGFKKYFRDNPYHFIHYNIRNKSGSNYGIATFSKYPVVNSGIISFPNSRNETIFTDISINGDTVRIYNNHLQSVQLQKKNYNFLDSLGLKYDDEQIREIKDISSRLKRAYIKRSAQVNAVSAHVLSSPYPVIICGDFNDTPVSYSYRIMKKGMHDAFVNAGRGTGSTYYGIFPEFRIDFIFHDNNFQPVLFEKLESTLSDHYPIFCTFRIHTENSSDTSPKQF
jgi:endonuclease/exonuclease/phosphatase family metal-dependent hydrolase